MHVLAVSQSYFPYLKEGGRPTKVRAIAAGLRKRGHRVTVLTAKLGPLVSPVAGQPLAVSPCEYGYRADDEGIDVVYLRSLLRRRTVTLNSGVLRFCASALESVDVVHIFGIYDLLGPIVAARSRRVQIPYVVETMGMFRPFSRTILGKRFYHRLVGRSFMGSAERLIATSDREAAELLEGGIPKSRIVIRANGVDPPPAIENAIDFRERFRIPRDARIVLFLGRIIALKSPDMLLRAFSRLLRASEQRTDHDWHLVIAGPPEELKFGSELRRLAEALNVAGSVTFAPALYGLDKWQAYRAASVFVLPSISENFGNAAAEAIAAGTPVIVTDQCGIAGMIQSTTPQPGLVVPHNEEALAHALLRLSNEEGLLEVLRVGCRVAGRDLGWDQPIAQVVQLYSQITSGGSSLAILGNAS